MGKQKNIVIIGEFSVLSGLESNNFLYQQFPIQQTQEALAFILENREDIYTIIARSYNKNLKAQQQIKTFIQKLAIHKDISIGIHILTDNKRLCGEDMSNEYGLTKGKDFFHCGSVKRNLQRIISGYTPI